MILEFRDYERTDSPHKRHFSRCVFGRCYADNGDLWSFARDAHGGMTGAGKRQYPGGLEFGSCAAYALADHVGNAVSFMAVTRRRNREDRRTAVPLMFGGNNGTEHGHCCSYRM